MLGPSAIKMKIAHLIVVKTADQGAAYTCRVRWRDSAELGAIGETGGISYVYHGRCQNVAAPRDQHLSPP